MPIRSSPRTTGVSFPATAALPVYLTPLVGRSREVAELSGLVRTSRMVSLVGPGGSGKTRLAASVARGAPEREDVEAAWIDLTALTDPFLVDRHVASALGLREHPSRHAAEALVELLGAGPPVLLVLDSCEHVLGACSILVDALLRGCPSLRVLTTTRQALGVAGEKAWQVPPLGLPGKNVPVADSEAVHLFVQRAADALPGFDLTVANAGAVARICRRLDGLPLAIELAAARIRVLPPEQLADRLDDRFGLLTTRSETVLLRHRTLRRVLDWSHALLSHEERILFRRLSVFAGGFGLDAAESVLGCDGLGRGDVLELLADLVDRSLVTMRECRGEARYSLLETVRAYAQERLAGSGDERPDRLEAERLHRAHARYFAGFVEEKSRRLRTADPVLWLEWLDLEHENLRVALDWATRSGEAELALRLCVGLRDFWRLRGHLSEGLAWMDRALALAGGPDPLRARTLVGAAILERMQGDYVAPQGRLAESEAMARRLGDEQVLADSLTQLAASLRDRGELAGARERLDEAGGLWRALDDPKGLTLALGVRASIALAEGDLPRARHLRLEAVEISRRAGDREDTALGLIGLGEVARLHGDLDGSRGYYERSLALFRELGDRWHEAAARHNLGWVAVESGRHEEAFRAFAECAALFRGAGNPFGLTLCLYGLARVLHEAGDAAAAGAALATASLHAARVGVRPAAPADIAACERTRALIEGSLDAEGRERAHAAVRHLDLLEGIARAEERLEDVFPGGRAASGAASGKGPTAPAATEPVRAEAAAREGAGEEAAAPQDSDPEAAAGGSTRDAGSQWDLQVRALGPLRILVEGRPLAGEAFGSSKPRELLVLLLCHPDGCTREQVGLAFWPDASAVQVKNSFHVTLHRLRKVLGRPEWIVSVGERYRLDPALRIDFDVPCFEAGIGAAVAGNGADDGHRKRLDAALDLYRGDFLEGEPVGDWHLDIRDRLRRLWVEGALARAAGLAAAGHSARAAGAYRALLARDRLHEGAWRQLMLCHARLGERVEAMRAYETAARLLQDELGLAPQPETTSLYEQIAGGHAPLSLL